MKKKILFVSATILLTIPVLLISLCLLSGGKEERMHKTATILPAPDYESSLSLEEALLKRQSVRSYKKKPVTLKEVSQLLWASQGITRDGFFRTTPSAGALYPLEVYLIAGEVTSLLAGVYRYVPGRHALLPVVSGDLRQKLARASLGQNSVADGAAVLVIAAVYRRVTAKYHERGIRYAHMEAGNASQNIYLQAVSLNLGTVLIGAFHDEKVKHLLQMKKEETPLCVMPIGKY